VNIFYLDDDMTKCAQYHCDAHVVKMILESAQILCTVLNKLGQDTPYKPTHPKHPCVLWAGASLENWLWLQAFTAKLNDEYQYRFCHDEPHKSFTVSTRLTLPKIQSLGITERPLAMPDEYKVHGNPVQSYRQFYAHEKTHILKYTKRHYPGWLKSMLG